MALRLRKRKKGPSQAELQAQFDNSAENKQFNELRGMAGQLGVDASKLGNFSRGNAQNNIILEKLRNQVNAASQARNQRPSITFGDAAPAALRAPNQQANPSQPNPAAPPMGQPQQPQGLSLQQFQQQGQQQPKQPQQPQQPQQPSTQGFQPNQPQGAQQNNTTQRFQQLRNQFTQQAPQQQAPTQQPAQQQPASQQTQQPAQQQQNMSEEEKKRLGQM